MWNMRLTFWLGCLASLSVWSASAAVLLPDFTELVAQQGQTVVKVTTLRKAGVPAVPSIEPNLKPKLPELPDDEVISEMLKRFLGEGVPQDLPPTPQAGSGFIISAEGEIVTNHHVVDGADEIKVELQDGRSFTAQLLGSDLNSDIALLKIATQGLPVARFGSSQALKVGEWVLAIGSPFGFDYSVTAGIVSAKGRSLPTENYIPFIQTDVAINPGNSGGPLFNLRGEVIGVNSQIYTRSRGYMGLSFAVPADLALDVVRQLRQHGKVSRGWLGVLVQNLTPELLESFGLEKPEGALIAKVLPNGPAARAGVKVGDVILALGQQPVASATALPPLVAALPIDAETALTVWRDKQKISLNLKVEQLPTPQQLQAGDSGQPSNTAQPPAQTFPLGMQVVPLPAGDVRDGVRVDAVLPGGAAALAGIRKDDVLLMLDQKPIANLEQFQAVVASLGDKMTTQDVTITAALVQRQGNPLFLALKLKKAP